MSHSNADVHLVYGHRVRIDAPAKLHRTLQTVWCQAMQEGDEEATSTQLYDVFVGRPVESSIGDAVLGVRVEWTMTHRGLIGVREFRSAWELGESYDLIASRRAFESFESLRKTRKELTRVKVERVESAPGWFLISSGNVPGDLFYGSFFEQGVSPPASLADHGLEVFDYSGDDVEGDAVTIHAAGIRLGEVASGIAAVDLEVTVDEDARTHEVKRRSDGRRLSDYRDALEQLTGLDRSPRVARTGLGWPLFVSSRAAEVDKDTFVDY